MDAPRVSALVSRKGIKLQAMLHAGAVLFPGAVAFVTNRAGVCWEVRRFQSVGGSNDVAGGLSFGERHLSFWRATVAVVIRY